MPLSSVITEHFVLSMSQIGCLAAMSCRNPEPVGARRLQFHVLGFFESRPIPALRPLPTSSCS